MSDLNNMQDSATDGCVELDIELSNAQLAREVEAEVASQTENTSSRTLREMGKEVQTDWLNEPEALHKEVSDLLGHCEHMLNKILTPTRMDDLSGFEPRFKAFLVGAEVERQKRKCDVRKLNDLMLQSMQHMAADYNFRYEADVHMTGLCPRDQKADYLEDALETFGSDTLLHVAEVLTQKHPEKIIELVDKSLEKTRNQESSLAASM
ncbi:hypothetical protein [Neptuniibacter sp. QD37_11]|uniref:hypothetical protein n=1 Tax=Neptuniibacter sp. QD37_11 TaxID=3398209 RepID=UPI0039F5B419